jgi:hypothetical protein
MCLASTKDSCLSILGLSILGLSILGLSVADAFKELCPVICLLFDFRWCVLSQVMDLLIFNKSWSGVLLLEKENNQRESMDQSYPSRAKHTPQSSTSA